MRKLILAVLIAASAPAVVLAGASEDKANSDTIGIDQVENGELVFVAPLDAPEEFSSYEKDVDPSSLAGDSSAQTGPLTLEQIAKFIKSDDFELVSPYLDYTKMHSAYISQMEYINGKVRSLSDHVGGVAAGTFETRVREGSMMLGLISEAIDSIVNDAAKDEDNFKKFIRGKFKALSMVDASYAIEEDDGVFLISITQPRSESEDIITAFRLPDGSFKLVAFIPSEMEEINDIINGLFLAATSSENLNDEIQRRALIDKAIGVKEHREASSGFADIDKAIVEAQSGVVDVEQ